MDLLKELDARFADDPKPRIGKGRREFLTLKDEIGRAIAGGYTVREIWEYLHEKGFISIKYETFSDYVRRYGLRQTTVNVPARSNPSVSKTVKMPPQTEKTPQRDEAQKGKPAGFKHDPTPKKENLI